ncbi:MAG: MFS transporter [Gammaproteobacteria bacterium]
MQKGFRLRAWGMVSMGAFMDFVATGLFFYSYGVFFPVIIEEFEINRSSTSLGISLFLTVTALFSPAVGVMLNRFPMKNVFSMGALTMATGLWLISVAPSALLLLPGVIICGIGAATLGQIAPPRLVANWFVHRRGFALGLTAVGISLSGVIMPLVANQLITHLGWAQAVQSYALFAACIVAPVALFFIIEKPQDVGLLPDGNPNQAPLPPPIKRLSKRYRSSLIYNPSIWLLAFLFGAQFCTVSAVLIHIVPLGIDKGLSSGDAALLLSLTASLAVVGKIVIGGASDRIPIHLLLLFSIALQTVAALLLFGPSEWWAMVAGAALFGMGYGGLVPLQNQLFARAFGRSMALAMGISRPMMLPLQLLGPPVVGLIFDLTGSYDSAAYFLLSMMLIAAVLSVLQQRYLRHT